MNFFGANLIKMKKARYIIVLTGVILVSAQTLLSLPGGAPANSSGSPASSSRTCVQSGCHGGSVTTQTNIITSTIPTDGYTPGAVYTVTVSVSGTLNKGFELSCENSSGTQIGKFAAGTGSQILNSGMFITHTARKSTNPAVWTFNWTAPSAGAGSVSFYGAFARSTGTTYKQVVSYNEKVVLKPLATTLAATNITTSSATLNASGNAKGLTNIAVGFQYGKTNAYGTFVAGNPQWLADTITTALSANLSALTSSTTYHYRVVLINGTDSTFGSDNSFTTANMPGGISNISNDQFIVYPNPVSNEFSITSENAAKITALHLYALDGKNEFDLTFEQTNASTRANIPTEIKNGVYILQVISNNKSHYQRIIVNH